MKVNYYGEILLEYFWHGTSLISEVLVCQIIPTEYMVPIFWRTMLSHLWTSTCLFLSIKLCFLCLVYLRNPLSPHMTLCEFLATELLWHIRTFSNGRELLAWDLLLETRMLNSPHSQTGQDTTLVSQCIMWLGGFITPSLGGLNFAEQIIL